MALLEIKDLQLSIGKFPILREIDLSVDAGEILGVIGESGSGKSMTALSIMQLLPFGATTSGSIKLDGREVLGLPDVEMRKIRGGTVGMVFQEPMTALNPVKTIGDQVAETAMVHGGLGRRAALEVARQTLERVELPTSRFPLDRYPHELSGGQRQRVVTAMAIAMRPKLLIADEPTTALDVTTQAAILRLLQKLVDEDGMGLLFITHDLGVIAGLADKVSIMRQGEVVEAGPTVALFRNLRHPYSKALFQASSHVPPRIPPAVAGGTPVLSVDNVVREYPLPRRGLFEKRKVLRAVDGVSLRIEKGENVGLVGESGCGKSTLARAIMALEPTQGGRIAIAGEPIDPKKGASFATRRQLQVVFQDPYGSFNPRHRVDRLVSEPFHLLGSAAPTGTERDKRIARALEEVGLSAADADKYVHEFSGGQRQRIAIARALIIEPSLIILDEAVSALDVSVRAQVLDLLADLSDRLQLSYLFISHDLAVVRSITDRVLVMRAGKIVEEGATEEVFRAPRHPYTQELLAATPNLEGALAKREAAGA
ncbi:MULTISPECIES: ABC transporter ATP-binding protein [unclassified Devosia]|uniref:ABC transporter ATP-binding protein n=3 Tax=Devosia TaxID=46913 RepID=UPI00086CE5EF|nr:MULTISPECIES: dipeptide ABC transporter ATP-binding protein [unclassified Devosia]MBN9361359.1 ABC transporter ATP-binding protein [Devosia sp.]ODS85901.1 MAG: microcin ABC transporter ATP-binding protein [Devosia sp. SCN 66-27]OJX26437.1 MAG: microcin ABC transporter ATP-binding protein [Devosia sp. 66-14]